MKKIINQLEKVAQYTGDVMTTKCTQEFHIAYEDGIITEIDGRLLINTPEGTKIADKGDYIIKDSNGHFYPCNTDVFENYKSTVEMELGSINIVQGNDLYFAKVRDTAKIPTKDSENMGYDIYADFEENFILLQPHETKMIPTGICSACSGDYAIVLKERGSTGTKGIAQRCGVIDSGYRNEWFVPITNTTDYPLIISKLTDSADIILKKIYGDIAPNKITIYPYEKAICQAVILPVPKMNVREISLEELKAIPSKRGEGCLGSSGK